MGCSDCFAMVSFQIAFPFSNICNTINDAILIRKENIVDKYRHAFTHTHTRVRARTYAYTVWFGCVYISFCLLCVCCCHRNFESSPLYSIHSQRIVCRNTLALVVDEPKGKQSLRNGYSYEIKRNRIMIHTRIRTQTHTHTHTYACTFATKRNSCTWKWYRCLSINW